MFALIDRIRGLIDKDDPRFEDIAQEFRLGALREPHTPMSDSELALAIREYLDTPRSRESTERLQGRFEKVGDPLHPK